MNATKISPPKTNVQAPIRPSGLRRLLDGFSFPQSVGTFLGAFGAGRAPQGTPARIVEISDETPTCKSFVLKPRGLFTHQAGQFITLTLNIEGAWQQRCYSISSADCSTGSAGSTADKPSDTITITVQAQTDGAASNYLHSRKAGDVVYISEAMGEFVAPNSEQPLLLITGGSGITPVMSMLRSSLLSSGHAVSHLHYAPDGEHAIFADELQALASANSHYQLKVEHTRQGGMHYSDSHLAENCPDWQQRQTLLCGPASLMQAVSQDWSAAGVAAQLIQESFGAVVNNSTDWGGVHFTASDKKVAADEAREVANKMAGDKTNDANSLTLLETAEAIGLTPQHGCRNGICHSCDCHLLKGTVRNLRTGELIQTSADRGPVFIQPCISTAVGDVEVEL